MWIYDYSLKNGERYMFYTDEPYIPDEVVEFCKNNKGKIKYKFCDHFPQTVKSYIKDSRPDNDICVVICNNNRSEDNEN